jgi:hypothetical protein
MHVVQKRVEGEWTYDDAAEVVIAVLRDLHP